MHWFIALARLLVSHYTGSRLRLQSATLMTGNMEDAGGKMDECFRLPSPSKSASAGVEAPVVARAVVEAVGTGLGDNFLVV